jgi:hypothetical protein
MKKIVCSISTLSIGCTFVDWSIHFLAGKKQYYSFAQQKWMPLVSNPLTDCNAHGHDRNHPGGIENVTAMLQQAKNMPDDGLYSMYPCSSESNYVREKLKLDLEKINEKEFWQKELDWYADEYSKIFDCCINNTAKVIFIHDNESINWYKFFGHLRVKHNVPEHDLAEIEYKRQHFQKNSIDQWKNLKLENIWDNRERQALDLRLFDIATSKKADLCDFSKPHFRAGVSDLWHRGIKLFHQIMLYLDIPINPDRLAQWIPIYHEWAQKPLALMQFGDGFDDTIQCIVNGWYKELPELTFDQEVMIQHALIYKHNLNLKTWQLEKFPSNTIDLHQLLEPNIHKLVHTYDELRIAKFN